MSGEGQAPGAGPAADAVAAAAPASSGLGARRWVALLAIGLSAVIISLDTSLLSVAIPTVMEEFDASLPSVQWVLTGYSLVFASLLVIGGRLGDLYGHRRMFTLGGLLFALGSLMAACSWSVQSLFIGEALIEGIGACLMLPSAMAMISTGFTGKDRATAFSMLGASVGLGAALGPLLGGFFTSELTWRLGFGINVLIAPVAVLGVLVLLPPSQPKVAGPRLDFAGAILLATGMFSLVFALSEGGTYGWWRPQEPFTIAKVPIWPESIGVSVVPAAIVVALALLTAFVVVEKRKERAERDPLIEFSGLHHKRFRYGLATTSILAMGQLALVVVLSVFLQSAAGLSAVQVGVWLIPLGTSIIIGSRLGAVIANRYDAVLTVRCGLVLQATGMLLVIARIGPGITFTELAVGLVVYGLGIGAASAQLVNVILSDVDPTKSGVASGTNSTVRQVGAALGIATVSTILTEQTINATADNIRAAGLPARLQESAMSSLARLGTSFVPPTDAPPTEAASLLRALADGMSSAARPTLWFALGTLLLGLAMSLLMPRPERASRPAAGAETASEFLASLVADEPLGEITLDRSPRS